MSDRHFRHASRTKYDVDRGTGRSSLVADINGNQRPLGSLASSSSSRTKSAALAVTSTSGSPVEQGQCRVEERTCTYYTLVCVHGSMHKERVHVHACMWAERINKCLAAPCRGLRPPRTSPAHVEADITLQGNTISIDLHDGQRKLNDTILVHSLRPL